MVADEVKFRANHAYDINFGGNKPSDPFLSGVERILKYLPMVRTCEVILDLSNPDNYKYSVEKQ